MFSKLSAAGTISEEANHFTITAYHRHSNGQVEMFNRTVEQSFHPPKLRFKASDRLRRVFASADVVLQRRDTTIDRYCSTMVG